MKNKPHKCKTKYCRGTPAKGRKKKDGTETHKGYCPKCTRRRWKEKNPIAYLYFQLKYNALRRGKVFDITREQFDMFIYQNPDYLKYKSKTKHGKLAMSIDRIDVDQGYTIANIQAITISENSTKRTWEYSMKSGKQDGDPF